MDLKDTYNRIAKDWHKGHMIDTWWKEATDRFASLVANGGRILDVGCGGGFKSNYLSEKGFDVVGIDFAENLVAIAKREVPKARFFVMDMRELSSLPGTFDGIFAQASLLHIPKKEISGTLSTLVSKLNNQGYLYVGVKGVKPGNPDEEVRKDDDYGYEFERFFSYFTPLQLRAHFEALGLAVVYENAAISGKTEWLQIIGQKAK